MSRRRVLIMLRTKISARAVMAVAAGPAFGSRGAMAIRRRAVPQVIGWHAHPKAPPDEDDPAPAALTGIDYLQLVTDADTAALGEQLNLAALIGDAQEGGDPGGDDAGHAGGQEDGRG
jgi:hypothetical protein